MAFDFDTLFPDAPAGLKNKPPDIKDRPDNYIPSLADTPPGHTSFWQNPQNVASHYDAWKAAPNDYIFPEFFDPGMLEVA